MADRPGVSFHTLRRTFATGILRNNAGMDAVMDALGHHDNSTAVKYLSFDDERMMECPLSLSGIAVEGGALWRLILMNPAVVLRHTSRG